jgi:ABC-2 type transport system ATP-binding protein
LRTRLDYVCDKCALGSVWGKTVSKLSRGYRQRVGMAQALLHDPEVLILDEPTSGLDPNQIVEVRKLIQRLGEQFTVVLSTHYLQEVEKSCSRVIIVNQGEIVADGTHDDLVSSRATGGMRARVRAPEAQVVAQCAELLPGCPVTVVERGEDGVLYRIEVGTGSAPIDEAFARLVVKNGWDLLEMYRERPSLEDVFRELTLGSEKEVARA